MLLETRHNKNIKMILLIEKRFLFISSDLLSIKVTPAKSQSQIYLNPDSRAFRK
jgi:hypothetical protein